MNAPQIIVIILLSVGLLIGAHDHGKPKTGEESFWVIFLASGLLFLLLYWGGFWETAK